MGFVPEKCGFWRGILHSSCQLDALLLHPLLFAAFKVPQCAYDLFSATYDSRPEGSICEQFVYTYHLGVLGAYMNNSDMNELSVRFWRNKRIMII